MTIAINNKERLFPKQELLGSSPQKRKGCAWRDGWRAALGGARGVWMGGTRLWRGPAVLECWHAALELGARGVWMGGTRLWSRAPAVLMHVPGTFNIDGLSAGWVTACTHTC